jgi:tRNA nucleotidyltransferase (CCA-adding enzyme)
LLKAIHPDLTWDRETQAGMFAVEPPADDWGLGSEIAGVPFGRAMAYILWLMPLPPDRSVRIARRLGLRNALAGFIADARRLREALPELAGLEPSQITFRLDEFALPAVYAVWRASGGADHAEPLARYARTWRHVRPVTDGHALEQLGLPPGPAYKQILTALRRGWLDGEITSEKEELQYLDRLLKAEPLR